MIERLVRQVTAEWVADPESDVVWAGEHDGRMGVRLAQRTRDFTTVWIDIGERTLGVEAYLLPAPPTGRDEIHRQALRRNRGSYLVHIAIDGDGDLYIVGRIPVHAVDRELLELLVGEVYELVDLSFRPMLRAMREAEPEG